MTSSSPQDEVLRTLKGILKKSKEDSGSERVQQCERDVSRAERSAQSSNVPSFEKRSESPSGMSVNSTASSTTTNSSTPSSSSKRRMRNKKRVQGLPTDRHGTICQVQNENALLEEATQNCVTESAGDIRRIDSPGESMDLSLAVMAVITFSFILLSIIQGWDRALEGLYGSSVAALDKWAFKKESFSTLSLLYSTDDPRRAGKDMPLTMVPWRLGGALPRSRSTRWTPGSRSGYAGVNETLRPLLGILEESEETEGLVSVSIDSPLHHRFTDSHWLNVTVSGPAIMSDAPRRLRLDVVMDGLFGLRFPGESGNEFVLPLKQEQPLSMSVNLDAYTPYAHSMGGHVVDVWVTVAFDDPSTSVREVVAAASSAFVRYDTLLRPWSPKSSLGPLPVNSAHGQPNQQEPEAHSNAVQAPPQAQPQARQAQPEPVSNHAHLTTKTVSFAYPPPEATVERDFEVVIAVARSTLVDVGANDVLGTLTIDSEQHDITSFLRNTGEEVNVMGESSPLLQVRIALSGLALGPHALQVSLTSSVARGERVLAADAVRVFCSA